jgi:hypothetical protein
MLLPHIESFPLLSLNYQFLIRIESTRREGYVAFRAGVPLLLATRCDPIGSASFSPFTVLSAVDLMQSGLRSTTNVPYAVT